MDMPATNVYLRHKQGPGINDINEVSQATGEWTLQKTTWHWGVRLEYIHFPVNVEAQSSNNLTKNGDVLKNNWAVPANMLRIPIKDASFEVETVFLNELL